MGGSAPGGSIFDLGYQAYEGPRLGRRSAITALFAQTVRACFGIGRGGKAKIAPFVLAGLAVLPAIVAVGLATITSRVGPAGGAIGSPIDYSNYHGLVGILIMLFCAAQAPELFGRDQRYGTLPLYFSRVLTRTDYAVAKVGGLVTALFLVDVAPYLILFVGRVFVAPDPVAGLTEELGAVPKFVLQSLADGRSAGRTGLARRRLDAAAGLRDRDDHRRVHHPADHRGAGRGPDQPGPVAGDRPVQPGRCPRWDEFSDLRLDPRQRRSWPPSTSLASRMSAPRWSGSPARSA